MISLLNDGEMILDNSNLIGKIVIICLVLTLLSIPLSMSIYLGWNFSSINKNLSIQLEQVKLLSRINLEQEQEKQRILENKKVELETEVLERTAELREEKKKSDDLLLNILPSEIAEELKQKGSALARDYEKVTVMFTDFKDFTKISEQLSPAELVKEIDICFRAFDEIIQKHGIEKIKTIGDAYMCVGGLPVPDKNHALNTVKAALEIRDFMNKHNQQKTEKGEHLFRIRIGIHTGSVVAGIVGVKKFAYDIWGDTVNIAARIESSGEPDKINISGSTYELIKDNFIFTYRGKIEAKNKGQIDMYFVENFETK
jgi:class 3 adenylate cyclase